MAENLHVLRKSDSKNETMIFTAIKKTGYLLD